MSLLQGSFLCQLRHRQFLASSAPGILLERALFGFETGISTWKPWGAEGSYQTSTFGAELLLQPSPHSLSPGLSYGRAGIVPKGCTRASSIPVEQDSSPARLQEALGKKGWALSELLWLIC